MKKRLSCVFTGFAIILLSLEHCETGRYERLLKRKLSSSVAADENNFSDIREIVSASLSEGEPRPSDAGSPEGISNESVNGPETKRSFGMYDETGNGPADEEVPRPERSELAINSDQDANPDASSLTKKISKRESSSEDEYDEEDSEMSPESSAESSLNGAKREAVAESPSVEATRAGSDAAKNKRRDALLDDSSNLDYERQIEEQIQRRIDSIKDEIKREIEKKQQAREIEANNAKFDELVFPSGDEEENSAEESYAAGTRSKRDSAPDESIKENAPLPVKKREGALKRVILVRKRNVAPKKRDRSAILIPEQGHAEIKDYLPADLTLDPKLRIGRSDEQRDPSRLTRSVRDRDDCPASRRRRRDETLDANEVPAESGNFLFPSQEREPRGRLRRSRVQQNSSVRGKRRKHARHARRHRAIREPWTDESDRPEERDKRAMSLDEDAALEYKESFGGFPSDTGGVLGRYKRIKRIADVPQTLTDR